jgi:geranylgeranyl reductase
VEPKFEIYLDSRLFKAWYAWIFPHKESIAVGCCCDPGILKAAKLRDNFHAWLQKKGIEPEGAILGTCPISYDYRGVRFGNIFLAGEAAGMASGLSGEGIYQSLVSGQEVARMILDPGYESAPLRAVIRYNTIQNRFMRVMLGAGIFRGVFIELIIGLMNRKKIQAWVGSAFS